MSSPSLPSTTHLNQGLQRLLQALQHTTCHLLHLHRKIPFHLPNSLFPDGNDTLVSHFATSLFLIFCLGNGFCGSTTYFFWNFLWLRYDLSLARPKGHAAWHIIKRKPAQTRSLCRLGLTGKEWDPNQNIWHVEKQPYEIYVKAGRDIRWLVSWDQSHIRCPLQLLGTCWSDNLHSNHNEKSSSL